MKKTINLIWKLFLITLIALLIPIFIYADGWTSSQPSHSTLYTDTITSKTDGSSVNIADAQGLFVTGDITTLGKVGIGTTNPSRALHIADVMRLAPRATAPSSPGSGDIYVDSTPSRDELCFYDGSSWQAIASGTDANCA